MSNEHPSRYALNRYAAELLEEGDAGAVRDHLAGCDHCRARLEAMEAQAAPYLLRHPQPPAPRPSVWSRLAGRLGRPPWAVAAASAVAVAVAVVVLPQVWPDDLGRGPGPVVRTDDGSSFELSVGRGPDRRPFVGQSLRPQDVLQLRYSTGLGYLVLLRVEHGGEIEVVVPAGEDRSAAIEPGRDRLLPVEIAVKSASGPQRILAVASDAPLAVERVRRAVRSRLASLPAAAQAELELGDLGIEAQVTSWLIPRVAP